MVYKTSTLLHSPSADKDCLQNLSAYSLSSSNTSIHELSSDSGCSSSSQPISTECCHVDGLCQKYRFILENIEEKNNLIKNLEYIIDEQETEIASLKKFLNKHSITYDKSYQVLGGDSQHGEYGEQKVLKGISYLSLDFAKLSDENLELKKNLQKAEKELDRLKLTNNMTFAQIPIMVDKEVQDDREYKNIKEKNKLPFDLSIYKKDILSKITNFKNEKDEFEKAKNQLLRETNNLMRQETNKIIELFMTTLNNLSKNYKKEIERRKKLHDEIVKLKGNIRVFCRIRPFNTGEEYDKNLITTDPYDVDQLTITNDNGSNKKYSVDKVFKEIDDQENIYNEISPVVTSCIDGKNVCIFAYGHTGSGKTYTMDGPDSNPGIVKRAISELFKILDDQKEILESKITVSMIEIYNEKIRDLFSPGGDNLMLKLGENGKQEIRGLSEQEVTNVNNVEDLIKLGRKNRCVASTAANETSSRSHSITLVNVITKNKITNVECKGKLNLIDLAGSERVSKSQVVGQQLKETQCINKSLSELGNVVLALRAKASHVPYRNCLLTRLLEDSLQGDSKTLMIVQITKNKKYLSEAISSLTFADKISKVSIKGSSSKSRTNTSTLSLIENAERKKYRKSISDVTIESDISFKTDSS
ncbi:Kinesin-like protein KIFC3 [Strongyloides ratti]|uniref:Kinesin-like protein n=1 Tax=Strongyloides ratti TaxID=34506 RepID=A0A090KWB2_STRRB|nr:Kinesin-like protein KIFC3 [Strongyloides ratti]CEF59557.1 Kinesin-like protein KIFC3 [Strongyloides ratti]